MNDRLGLTNLGWGLAFFEAIGYNWDVANEYYPKGWKLEVRMVGVAISDELKGERQTESLRRQEKDGRKKQKVEPRSEGKRNFSPVCPRGPGLVLADPT